MAKIDLEKLDQLIREGKSPKELAEYFNSSLVAIWKAQKRLSGATTKEIIKGKEINAQKVINKNLNTIGQLQKINNYANELLDLLMKWQRGDEGALQVLESQVSSKKVRVGKKIEFIKEFKFKDPRDLAIKAMGEIRGQLALQLEIFKTLYDLQAAQEFQEEVLNAIKEVDPDVREKIIRRLQERRSLRSAFSMP